jgi:outer membrane protein assembly factor BamA
MPATPRSCGLCIRRAGWLLVAAAFLTAPAGRAAAPPIWEPLISQVSFTGNTFVSSAMLAKRLETTAGKVLKTTENDANELIKYYRSFGFHDVKVARELHYSPDGKEVSVTFHIVEGVRYKIQDFPQVIGAKSVPAETLVVMNKVRPGMEYNQAKIDEVVGNVPYEVEEKPAPGQTILTGSEQTRDNVIRRQVPLDPGQIVTYPAGSAPNALVGLGINSDTGLTGSIVLNECNFDITLLPTSLDDLFSGPAFRGAGQEFRSEAVSVPAGF